MRIGGVKSGEVGPVALSDEQSREGLLSFTPNRAGDGQKVEFILYKDGVPYLEEPLYLWTDVEAHD